MYANYGFDSKAVDSDASRRLAGRPGAGQQRQRGEQGDPALLRELDNSVYNKTDDLTTVYASFEGSHKFTQQAQVEYLLAFHDYDNGKDNTDNRKNYGAIVRPMYFWNDVHSTWLEAGYQRVDYDQGGDNHGWKLTLSQNIAIGMGPRVPSDAALLRDRRPWITSITRRVNGTQDQQLDSLNVGGMFEAWF
ncbi:carbohydrate porin [Klebsiella pneumoniae]